MYEVRRNPLNYSNKDSMCLKEFKIEMFVKL